MGRSPWQRGERRPRASARARAVALAGLTAVAVAGAAAAVASVVDAPITLVGDAGASGPPGAPQPGPQAGPQERDATHGALAVPPAARTGLAFLDLDDPLDLAVAVLGPPDRRTPDINGAFAHTWDLAPGTALDVIADDLGITGLAARAPVHPPVRMAVHAGVIIGESTPSAITARWGTRVDVARHHGEDFALRYVECAGPFPVVVKFDQDGAAPDVRWDEPVTSVLIAYADAEPGTGGCPAP